MSDIKIKGMREPEPPMFSLEEEQALAENKLKIFNLTQHDATAEQIAEGVIEPSTEIKEEIKKLLTFDVLPDEDEIWRRAMELADIVRREIKYRALIGGAPFLMGSLEVALRRFRITPMYSFSKRVSLDEQQEDGSIKKVSVFKHVGFIERG